MNKIYKVIWSKAKQCYVVVSEIARNTTKGRGKQARQLALAAIVGIGVAASTGVGVVHAAVDDETKNYVREQIVVVENRIAAVESKVNGGGTGTGTGSSEVTKAYVDEHDQANATAAEKAQTTANEAKTAAATAKTAADNAQTTANQAKTAADNAQTTANQAKTAAATADGKAVAAQDKADANEAAITKLNGTGEGSVAAAVKAEADRAKAAEKAAQDKADANEAAITKLNGTGEGSVAAAVKAEADRAKAAEEANANAISAEETRALAGEEAAKNQAVVASKAYTDTKLGATADGMYIAATNTVAENMTAIDNKLQDVQKITYNAEYKDTAEGSKIDAGATMISGPVVISGETEGHSTITINSETGRIKGLSNTDWVTDPTLDGSSVAATQGQLYDIASKGFQVKADNGNFNAPLASQISIVGDGTNITTASAEGSRELKINLSDSPTFKEVNTSPKAGKQTRYNTTTKEWEEVDVTTTTKFDGSGIYINPTGTTSGSANIVSLTASGLNNGRQQLKNIADGTDYTDAVTYKQLIAERIKIQGAGDAQVTFAPIIKEGTDIIEGTMYTITVTDKDTKPAGDGLTTSVSNGNVVSVKLAKAADGGAGSIIATQGENGGLTLNPVLTLNGGAQSITFDAPKGHVDGLTNITWYDRNLIDVIVTDPDTGEVVIDEVTGKPKTEKVPQGYLPNRAATEGQLDDIVNHGIGLGADNAVKTLPLNKTATIVGGANIATSIAEPDENGNLNLTVSTTPDVVFNTVSVKNLDPDTGLPITGTNTVSIDSQYVSGLKNTSFFNNKPTAPGAVVVGSDSSGTYLNVANLPKNVATSSKAATEAQLYDVVTGLDKADRYITSGTAVNTGDGKTVVTLTQNNAENVVFTITHPEEGGGGGGGQTLHPQPDDDKHPIAPGDKNADNWYIVDGGVVFENTTLATMESTREGKKSSVADITSAVDPLADSTRDQVTAKITSMADAEGNVTYGQNYTIMDTAGNAIQLSNLASASVLETVHSVVLNHDGRIRVVEDGFKLKAGTEKLHEGDVKPGETLEFTGNATSTNANIKIDYDNKADKIDISVVDNPKFTKVEVGAAGGKQAVIDSNGISFDGNYYIGPNGLDGVGNVIHRVGNGEISATSTDAINGGQLYPVKNAVEEGFTVNGYKINLIGAGTEGFTIGAGKNIVVNTNGSATTIATSMTPEFTAVTVGDTTVEGSTPILINAANQGTIRNLKNTTWTLNQSVPYSGQAATEDQLAIVDSGLTNLGMNFVGDTEGATIHKNLGQTLKIVGGATTVTEEDNIRVDYIANDGNPYLKIGLAKNVNLTPDGSIIANDSKFDSDGLTVTNGANLGADQQVANYNESGMTIIRPKNDSRHDLAFTDEYVSMGDNVITNVGSGLTLASGQTTPNLNNAATVGDVMQMATAVTDGKNTTAAEASKDPATGKITYKVDLNEDVKLGSSADRIVLKGSDGTATFGTGTNKVQINSGAEGTIKAGKVTVTGSTGNIVADKVTVNGVAGTVNGLTNKTWTPGGAIVSGQAATEDQLKVMESSLVASGWGLTADGTGEAKQELGKTLKIKGDDNITTAVLSDKDGVEIKLNDRVILGDGNKAVTIDGLAGTISAGTGDLRVLIDGTKNQIQTGDVVVDGTKDKASVKVGNISVNGTKGKEVITGLSNTEITWTKDTVLTAEQKSTAATQGQLKAYADSDTDWQLVANPAGGNYKVEASKVTLKVEDSKHTGTYKDVVIEDVASASNNVTNVAKNDAGDTITITQTINGTPNTVEFKNTNDYVVAGTYNMDKNGDVTLARKDVNGTALDSVIIKDVAKKSDLDEVASDYVKKVTVERNSMTINQVVGGEAAEPITFKNTNDYVVAGTYEVKDGEVTLARKDADGNAIDDVVITGIASSSDLENATLAYKANGENGQTVKLKDGLDFTNGTNTVATVDEKGVVTFDLKEEIDLGKDGSITIGGTEIKDESVTVGDTTITGDSITTDEVNVGDNITIDGDKDQITIKGDETTTTITGDEIKVGDTSITGDNISTKEIVINGSKLISVEGPANLAGTDITRIKFADHVIATMEDGLKFSADKGEAVSKKLNEELPIKGDTNITTQTGNGGIQVTLNKEIDLGEKGSITIGVTNIDGDSVTTNEVNVGDTTINEDGVTTNNITVEGDTSNTVIDGDKITVGDNTTIEDNKITVGDTIIEGDKITTEEIVINGNSLLIEGSNIKTVYGDTINRIKYTDANGKEQEVATMEDGLKFSADKGDIVNRKHNETLAIVGDGSIVTETDPDKGEIKVGLADKITVGSGDNKVEIDGTKGTITTGDVTIDGANKEITVGATTIGDTNISVGGADGVQINAGDNGNTINNLTNTDWGDNYTMVSGQAATEDQLKKVEDGIVEKGLDFADDTGTVVHRDLGEQLNIIGGATDTTKLTEGNIGVVAKGDDTLEIKLNSELTGLTKVQVGDNTTIEDNKITVGDIVIDGANKEITVGDNTAIGDGEATIGDITIDGNNKEITVGDNTTIGDGEATIGGVEIDGNNNTVTVGTGDNKVEIDGTNGTITTGDVTIDGANKEITVGDNTTIGDGTATFGDVTINEGDKGTINNLTNITWDKDKITSGQAATEDQLKAVEEGITGKGLNFVGDDSKEIHKDLGETLTIKGGADTTKLTEGNIGVTNKEGALFVELAKDIKVDSVNVGDGATVLNKDGSATIGKVEISKDGDIDNGKIQLNADGSASIADGNFQISKEGNINSTYAGGTIKADGNGFEVKHGDSSMKVDEAGTTISNGDSSTVINGDTINAGDNITIDGGEGVVSITGADGAKADITVAKGDKNLAGDEQTRITYGDSQVATLADGMKYTDDNGVVLKRKLNENLNILGGASELTEGNIGVVASGEDTLNIKLSKKISGLEEIKVGENTTIKDGEITVGDTVIDKSSVTTETVNAKDVNADNVTVKETVKVGDNITIDGTKTEIKVGDKTTITGDTVNTETVNATTVKTGDTTINNDGMTINNGPTVTKNKVDVAGNKIENVAPGEISATSTDAVNGSQLHDTNVKLNKLGNRVNRVGAQSAALAALHPMDFDPDDKLTFAAGVGHYHGSTAGAIGAFYRPDEKVMFSVSGTMAEHDNMINAGVSFSLDRNPRVTNTKTAMAREILDLRDHVAKQDHQIAQLVELVNKLTGNTAVVRSMATQMFPDVPENHWAYDYVDGLQRAGIIEGYPSGNYDGDRSCTRYEFAAMLYRALKAGQVVPEELLAEFKDELCRFRVDRVHGEDNQYHKYERIRVNGDRDFNRDAYGSKNPQAVTSRGAQDVYPNYAEVKNAAKNK